MATPPLHAQALPPSATPVSTPPAAPGQTGTVQVVPTPPGLPSRAVFDRRYDSPPVDYPAAGSLRWRMGVGVPSVGPQPFLWPEARPGWYLSWSINMVEGYEPLADPAAIDMAAPEFDGYGMEFVPLVKMLDGRLYYGPDTLTPLAAGNPGRTWIIGNEPDVTWQDNTRAEAYARAYHDAYVAIKAGDPTAQMAVAGLSQVTPLRLAYLDRVWAAYQDFYGEPMPVDVWTMHAYVLREEADAWGVAIPPGFEAVEHGILWDVADHDDLRLVENQIRLMRSWMARHGQQAKPLWITEYGVLMSAELGFPVERVQRFMIGSFELFRALRHPDLGDPADDGRLVQRWNWFSTYFEPLPTSDLFDAQGLPTPLLDLYGLYLLETDGLLETDVMDDP